MPSTNDYQKMFEQARRRGPIVEGRQVASRLLAEAVCPECGEDPCECEEERDPLEGAVPRESLDVMEILAATDPHTFTFMVECEGLRVAAVRDRDPLTKEALAEDIDAVAATITENPDEPDDRLDRYQAAIKEIAEDYGYCLHIN